MTKDQTRLGFWKPLVVGVPYVLLILILCLAIQPLGSQCNLYYVLWKVGLRGYDARVVLGGMFHDHSYRQRFIGMSHAEFEALFPYTFFACTRQPPIAKSNETYYIDDYQQAKAQTGQYGMCWLVVFRDGRLVEFSFLKG
jgi:hypothetical protein